MNIYVNTNDTFYFYFFSFWNLFVLLFLFSKKLQDYELDGVDWTKVDFEDNQECLNLIEKVF